VEKRFPTLSLTIWMMAVFLIVGGIYSPKAPVRGLAY
jgi:hypothetical protein